MGKVVVAILVVVGLLGVAGFVLAGGLDDTTTARASGEGVQVVRIALVDRAIGFDITPDVVEVAAGTHVVLEVVNEADGEHDLAIDGGMHTSRLSPGESERLDLGRISDDIDGHCTIGDHDVAGMTLDLRVV